MSRVFFQFSATLELVFLLPFIFLLPLFFMVQFIFIGNPFVFKGLLSNHGKDVKHKSVGITDSIPGSIKLSEGLLDS